MSQPRFMNRAMQQYKDFAFPKLMGKNIASFRRSPGRYLVRFFQRRYQHRGKPSGGSLPWYQTECCLSVPAMMLVYSPVLTVIACGFLPCRCCPPGGRAPMEQMERKISEKNEHFVAYLKGLPGRVLRYQSISGGTGNRGPVQAGQ